jgi:hypothetical protein
VTLSRKDRWRLEGEAGLQLKTAVAGILGEAFAIRRSGDLVRPSK